MEARETRSRHLIPHQIPHQKNGAHHSVSATNTEPVTAPAKLTDTLADTSVVHAIRGRVRLRVPALKTSPGLAEPLQRLLRDQPGVTDVTRERLVSQCDGHLRSLRLDAQQALCVAATTLGSRGSIVQICE